MILPEEELKAKHGFNFAPMIDFLFLMLALFATLAISRATIYDTKIDLVQLSPDIEKPSAIEKQEIHQINLSIAKKGNYKWITEMQTYDMKDLSQIQSELSRQYSMGVLPKDKNKTEILLHIDREASWGPIAKLMFSIRELGFEAHPVYEPNDVDSTDANKTEL